MKHLPTSDEKMMAALAHGSVLLSFLGPIVPVIFWSSQRRKSEYVRFHALQALGYQVISFWFWMFAIFGIVVLSMIIVIPLSVLIERHSSDTSFFPFIIQPFIFIGIFGVFGLYFLLGFIGAVFSFLGRDFRYPLLGNWLERYLKHDADPNTEINDEQEDNWVGGMCHMTAILQMWGMILPIIVWFTQKDGSVRLRFQAMQAAIYQGIAFVVYVLWTMLYFLLLGGMFFVTIIGSLLGDGGQVPPFVGGIMIIVLIIVFIFAMMANLAGPLYLIFALIAAVRVVRGKNHHYPVLGNIIEKRMMKPEIGKLK